MADRISPPQAVPTERQFQYLLPLGGGARGLSRTKRDAEPLLRRGWVNAQLDGSYYQWVEITPDGLRALALAVERYGLPEIKSPVIHARVCSECNREWRPQCKCGCRSSRYETREAVPS